MKKQPTLTLFCGLPGSGKTRIAKQIQVKTGAIRICTDDWLTDIHADLFDEKTREFLQQRLYLLAQELLYKGNDVILEDGLWSKQERDEKLARGKSLGAIVSIHVFDLSREELWRRLKHRNENLQYGQVPITKDQLDSYLPMFEKPSPDELNLFDQVQQYNNDRELVIT